MTNFFLAMTKLFFHDKILSVVANIISLGHKNLQLLLGMRSSDKH